jgi:hypothetical protein
MAKFTRTKRGYNVLSHTERARIAERIACILEEELTDATFKGDETARILNAVSAIAI